MGEKRRGIETQVERQSIRDAAERTLGTKKLSLKCKTTISFQEKEYILFQECEMNVVLVPERSTT